MIVWVSHMLGLLHYCLTSTYLFRVILNVTMYCMNSSTHGLKIDLALKKALRSTLRVKCFNLNTYFAKRNWV